MRWEPLTPPADDELPSFAAAKKPPSLRRTIAEIPFLVAIAVVVTFVVKALVAQAFFIPSESMEPQLAAGDRVVVSRLAYQLHDPRRGDVVVFDSPEPAPPDTRNLARRVLDDVLETMALKRPPETELIKRVVGLPGETVEGRDGHVYVNGYPLAEPYLQPDTYTSEFPRTRVPDDSVFVLGDNRANSADSRRIGPIPIDSIVGRAVARVWPPTRLAFL